MDGAFTSSGDGTVGTGSGTGEKSADMRADLAERGLVGGGAVGTAGGVG